MPACKECPRLLGLFFLLWIIARQTNDAGHALTDDKRPARTVWAIAVCDASINSHPLRACIDTGADGTAAVDTEILQRLGVGIVGTRQIETPHGVTSIDVYSSVVASVEGFPSMTVAPIGLDVRTLFGTEYPDFQAVLGLEYLSHRVVVINSGRVSVHPTLPSNVNTFNAIKMGDSAKELVHCDLLIEGHGKVRFRIDTGQSSACRMDAQLIERLKEKRICVEGLRTETRTISSVRTSQGFILRKVRLADVEFANVPVSVGNSNAIGLGILRHLNLAIDFPNQRLLVGKPPQDKIDRFPLNATGMLASFGQNEQLMVRAIRPDSPATKAGIEVGDEVVMIEGKDVEKLSFDDVTELFAQDGKTIQIQLRRGMDVRTVELALKLPFEYPPNWEAMDAKVEGFEKFLEEDRRNRKTDPK
ncbi:MAG: aspartyl protease family protein [Planctomycetota bacterium]